MFAPFRPNKTIGEAYNMDLEDSLKTKKALARLGHLEEPEDGFDEYPDMPMIDAVKSFQRANNLAEDGVMKPDGPTIKRLNQSLMERTSVAATLQPLPTRAGSGFERSETPGILAKQHEPPSQARTTPGLRHPSLLDQSLPKSGPRTAAHTPETNNDPSQGSTGQNQQKDQQVAAAQVAIPLIPEIPAAVRALLAILGLAPLMPREMPGDNEGKRECDRQYDIDSEECRRIKEKHGPRASNRCWESAALRLGNCLAGRPAPPLDRGVD